MQKFTTTDFLLVSCKSFYFHLIFRNTVQDKEDSGISLSTPDVLSGIFEENQEQFSVRF